MGEWMLTDLYHLNSEGSHGDTSNSFRIFTARSSELTNWPGVKDEHASDLYKQVKRTNWKTTVAYDSDSPRGEVQELKKAERDNEVQLQL
jgi:hypothetical protein